ncbi:MAG: helix-turn-helix domain-containing protein [Victivallales bacterium]|nr:helix-turn-helix domain-containing protein [Victivallales bacterium]
MQELNWSNIAPEIRGANYFESSQVHLGPRFNYAYQLLYVFQGTGIGIVNSKKFLLEPGTFCLYGPGDRHEFRCSGSEIMALGTVNFSWRLETSDRLSFGNRTLADLPPDYQNQADPLYRIAGLPDIPFVLTIPDRMRCSLEKFLRETGLGYRNSDDASRILKYKAALLEIVHILVLVCRETSGYRQHPVIIASQKYIRQHYAADISRRDVAQSIGISESYLTALLRHELQTNFTDFLTAIRMEAAIELLQFSRMSVKEIAARIGFNDYSYFVTRFRNCYGLSPGEFRRR